MATYMIYEGFLPKLESKMQTVGNKCKKYGLDFTFQVTGNSEIREVKDEGITRKLRYVEVIAEGKAQINDWEFIATVEHTEKGNIIRSVSDMEVPNVYYTSSPYCEHCRSDRYRKETYLVRNTEDGSIKQVGKSCLKDFTHGMDADRIAAYLSLFDELEESSEREPGYHPERDIEYFEVNEITRYISETIRHFGYVSRNMVNESDTFIPSTSNRAFDFYQAKHGNFRYFNWFKPEEGLKQMEKVLNLMESVGFNTDRPETVREAEESLKWIAEADDSRSTYIHNLKVTCSMGHVEHKHLGILCSLLPAWNKDLVKQEERKAEEAFEINSDYVGNVGDRIRFDVHSARILASWETEYGYSYLLKIVSTDGNVFTWKSSGSFPDDLSTVRKLVGTVKDHQEYKGTRQTVLTRCKLSA